MRKKPTLSVLKVMTPQRSNFVLTADIPYSETDVLVFYRFHIKTCRYETNIHIKKSLGFLPVSCKTVFVLPIVGMVVTISPSLSLYKIVVFPAASRPTMSILISFFPNILNSPANIFPMAAGDRNPKRPKKQKENL